MKCLSVRQPWASLICMGIKDVENRSWRPKCAPGRILVHASANVDKNALKIAEEILGYKLPELPRGAIVGTVEVIGFEQQSDSIWAMNGHGAEWKWILNNASLLDTPIAYKGRLNLFDVNEVEIF